MILKKLFVIFIFIVHYECFASEIIEPVAFNSNFDVMASVGVASYGNFPIYNSLDSTSTAAYIGYNMNLKTLYNLIETYYCYIVIGTGFTFTRATTNQTNNRSYFNYSTTDTKQGEMNSGFVDLYTGFKFILTNEMNFYTLGSFGYSIYDEGSSSDHLTTINYNNSSIDSYQTNQLTFSDHIKYGAEVILTYAVSDNYGFGFGLHWNQHKMAVSGNSNANVSNIAITTSTYNQNTNISSFSTFDEVTGSFLLYFGL